MNEDNRIEILIKLFETLKESSVRSEEMTQKLVMQQIELVNQIKNLPVSDLKAVLREHMKESKEDIDSCSGSIELHTSELKGVLQTILSRVNKMILIVALGCSMFGGIYAFARFVADDGFDRKHDIEVLKKELRTEREKIIQEAVDELKREINKLHTNNGRK